MYSHIVVTSGKQSGLLWTIFALDRPLSAALALDWSLSAAFCHFYFGCSCFVNNQCDCNKIELQHYLMGMIVYILVDVLCKGIVTHFKRIKGITVVKTVRNEHICRNVSQVSAALHFRLNLFLTVTVRVLSAS
jgi:hypothetical protein